jgi:hypothetical protein
MPWELEGGVEPPPPPLGSMPWAFQGGVEPPPPPLGSMPWELEGGVKPPLPPLGSMPWELEGGVEPPPPPLGSMPWELEGGVKPPPPPLGSMPWELEGGVKPPPSSLGLYALGTRRRRQATAFLPRALCPGNSKAASSRRTPRCLRHKHFQSSEESRSAYWTSMPPTQSEILRFARNDTPGRFSHICQAVGLEGSLSETSHPAPVLPAPGA